MVRFVQGHFCKSSLIIKLCWVYFCWMFAKSIWSGLFCLSKISLFTSKYLLHLLFNYDRPRLTVPKAWQSLSHQSVCVHLTSTTNLAAVSWTYYCLEKEKASGSVREPDTYNPNKYRLKAGVVEKVPGTDLSPGWVLHAVCVQVQHFHSCSTAVTFCHLGSVGSVDFFFFPTVFDTRLWHFIIVIFLWVFFSFRLMGCHSTPPSPSAPCCVSLIPPRTAWTLWTRLVVFCHWTRADLISACIIS